MGLGSFVRPVASPSYYKTATLLDSLTLVASALAGGDCIDDADALRAGGTVGVLGCVVKAPSTLGTFLRSLGGAVGNGRRARPSEHTEAG